MKMRIATILSMSLWCVLSVDSFAWNEIAHFSIGKTAGYSWEDCTYMNLPDLWDSKNAAFRITDKFCWSHSLQRYSNGYVVPIPPENATDDREPGRVMSKMIEKVNWNRHGGSRTVAEKTAMGFSKHNAADKVVHYAFFLGQGSLGYSSEARAAWEIHHQEKEIWADYWVYVRIVCNAEKKATITETNAEESEKVWNENGLAKQFYGVDIQQSGKVVNITADAFIIRMAQEAARKNRRTVDTDEQIPFTSVDSISYI